MREIDELLQAITALEAQRPVLGDRVVEAALIPLQEKLTVLERQEPANRQRRLVTVLFLDIVNSTALSQGLEPEEVQEMIGGALKHLSAPIEAYGGLVTQFMGDGFVAVFGISKTHENDARQAVRAGLAILAESQVQAAELKYRYNVRDFKVRIGVNTGRVVAGRFSEAESPVMGLTVSLAARIEQAATAGSLYISQFTYQHVRGTFELEALPPIEAKGFPQTIDVYKVLVARPRTFRTYTRGVEGIETRLVGRENELTQLKSTLTAAIQKRETHLVTIVGEAGVGKSRLLYEFDRWVAQEPMRLIVFKARSSPQMMTVAFGMLRDMITYRLGLLNTDPLPVTRQRLVDRLSEYFDDEPVMKAHFMGSLLGFDFSDSPYLQGMKNDPHQMRERAQLYLTQAFASAATKTPTIVLMDDLHWADIPSLSFITHLVSEYPQLPLLVVCLARPILAERFPEWGKDETPDKLAYPAAEPRPKIQWLELSPLTRQASEELLSEILRNVDGMPSELCDRILGSADGNPFYLEEFIQSLVDIKAIRKIHRTDHWRVDPEQLGNLELPATLIALLEARLDSLEPAQRVLLQQASTIGRVFWLSAVQAIRGDKTIVNSDLDQLSKRGFIHAQDISTFAGTDEYRFHHGMLRDAAYQALVKSDRQAYHGQAAAWLIAATQAGGRSGEFAPVIAEHYEAAGERELAAEWFTQSGNRARNQGATAQALSFFNRAIALLPLGSTPSLTVPDLMRRWEALAGRDSVLGILGNTEERMADDVAMIALAESIGDDHLVAEAYYRRGFYLGIEAQYPQELEAYSRGLEAARRVNDCLREALILGLKVVCQVRLGDIEEAAQTSMSAMACAEQVGDDLVLARNLTNVSAFYTDTGDIVRGVQLLTRQLEIIRQTGNIEGEAGGLLNLGYAYILLGMPDKGIPLLQRCIHLAESIGHRSFCAYGSLNLALAQLRSGDSGSSLSVLEQCLPELQAMNDVFGFAVAQTYAGLAREQLGEFNQALVNYEQAAAKLSEIGAIGNVKDAEAGEARCQLRLSNLEAAQQYAAPVWEYLQRRIGAGMEFPMLAYETCAEVYSSAGEEALARSVIEAGYRELMKRADKISLLEWRQSYLEHVPEHHRIQAYWHKYTQTSIE